MRVTTSALSLKRRNLSYALPAKQFDEPEINVKGLKLNMVDKFT